MKISLLTTAAVAMLALAGCQKNVETVSTTAPDPMAEELANAPAVELPPSMRDSASFRCKDNSLAYVDFFNGDKVANLRTEKDGEMIRLTAEKAGDPLTAPGGYKLSYALDSAPGTITLTTPEGGTQTCKH